MTFPSVEATASGATFDNLGSHIVPLPADIESGNLLLVGFVSDGAPAITWPSGWTVVSSITGPGNQVKQEVAYRQADGSEGASITVLTGDNERAAYFSYRISGHADPGSQPPEVSTGVTGTGTGPDPDSLAPSGGAKDYLWVAFHGTDGGAGTSAYPTGYDNNQISLDSGGSAHASGGGVATRQLNAAVEDPGAFVAEASEEWAAITMAVHPVGVDEADPRIERPAGRIEFANDLWMQDEWELDYSNPHLFRSKVFVP